VRPLPTAAVTLDRWRALQMNEVHKARGGWSWWYLLFVVQFVAVLFPSFYNKIEPQWVGIPFFYWYQMLWVIISAIFTAIVYYAVKE
jgi:uncharacterized membrane protein YhaH (DUF805 family)